MLGTADNALTNALAGMNLRSQQRARLDKMDEGNLNLVRAAELKHGRVAMLAVVGWVWTATGTHFSGVISSSKGITFDMLAAQPNPIAAAAMVRAPAAARCWSRHPDGIEA